MDWTCVRWRVRDEPNSAGRGRAILGHRARRLRRGTPPAHGHVLRSGGLDRARPNPDISFKWDEIADLSDQAVDDPFDDRSGWLQHTAVEARVGAAALGGAEDGRTMLHDMGFVEGLRGPVRDDQGAKNSFEIDLLGRTTVGTIAFATQPPPDRIPIAVYEVGNLAVVALPGEFTTMMGERIRRLLAAEFPSTIDRVLLAGLAGGHLSYVTTPEEYDAQHYEGGQNIYGAATGALVARRLESLVTQSAGAPPASRRYCYDAGKRVRWRTRDAAGPPYEVDEGLGDVVEDLVTRKRKSDFPTFCFRDAVPRLSEITSGGACARAIPDVYIETAGGVPVTVGGLPQNNVRGLDVVTVFTVAGENPATGKDATEWCAIWMTPPATPFAQYRFRVAPIVGSDLLSTSFQAGGLSPPFFSGPSAPLAPDRRDCILCKGAFDLLGLCPEPNPCEAP